MGGTRDPTPQTDTLVKQVWCGHAHDLVTRRLFPYIRREKATRAGRAWSRCTAGRRCPA
jgi:hypothetical protein